MTAMHGGGESRPAPAKETAYSASQGRSSLELVLHEMRKHNFAVLSTVDEEGSSDSAGICYGVSADGDELYIMSRRHLKKVRNIAVNPRVSVVVPLKRRLLRFLPPATIQLHGVADILDWADADGTRVFRGFWMGRIILRGYEKARRRGETRVCFLRIKLAPIIRTYGVGQSVWRLRRDMKAGIGIVYFAAADDAHGPRGVAGDDT